MPATTVRACCSAPSASASAPGGPLGLLERGGDLGGAQGRAEFSSQLRHGGGGLGELVAGAQRVGPAALAVGEALHVALAAGGLVEFGAVCLHLRGAGGGSGLGGRRELGGPPGLRVRCAV